jgi:hypothetical protein
MRLLLDGCGRVARAHESPGEPEHPEFCLCTKYRNTLRVVAPRGGHSTAVLLCPKGTVRLLKENSMKISTANLIRLAGLSALIGGSCYVFVGVFHPANVDHEVEATV